MNKLFAKLILPRFPSNILGLLVLHPDGTSPKYVGSLDDLMKGIDHMPLVKSDDHYIAHDGRLVFPIFPSGDRDPVLLINDANVRAGFVWSLSHKCIGFVYKPVNMIVVVCTPNEFREALL